MTGYADSTQTVPAQLARFNVTPLGWLVLHFTREEARFQRRINLKRPGAGMFMVSAKGEVALQRGYWDEQNTRSGMTIRHSIDGFCVGTAQGVAQALRDALWGGVSQL